MDAAWLERLNPWERQETHRQIDFKKRKWPEVADGAWSKIPGRHYPHILPVEHVDKAFVPSIAADVKAYFDQHDIAKHSEVRNLKSSQACCINFMFPLKDDLELAAVALRPVLPGVRRVKKIDFEFTGDEGATEFLGEPKNGKRGLHRTSIDVSIEWLDNLDREVLTLSEWKYTERTFGSCGGFRSKRNENKAACRSWMDHGHPIGTACYLTQGRHTRRYWERMADAGIDLATLSRSEPCPFHGPFYQLMRQFLLAAYLRRQRPDRLVEVATLSFRDNTALQAVPPNLRYLGSDIVSAWNNAISGAPPLRRAWVDDIGEALGHTDSERGRELYAYLGDRYGV